MRVIFAGTPDFALPTLDMLARWCAADEKRDLVAVYTRADKPAGRGRKLHASPVKERALALGLPVEQPVSLRTQEARQRLEELSPDLIVVVAYGLLLPAAVLTTPRLGCVNVHASLLPRWRGAAPIHWAILAGDSVTGVSIMQIDEGLDTGPVLLERQTAIGAGETGGQLHDRLAKLGAEAMAEVMPALVAGTSRAVPQDDAGAVYARRIAKADAAIDWRQSAAAIGRKVRAFNPWPVAETTLGGTQLRIWAAQQTARTSDEAPGRVLSAGADGIDVATGDGVLRLGRVQAAGGRAMPVREFLNAHGVDGVLGG